MVLFDVTIRVHTGELYISFDSSIVMKSHDKYSPDRKKKFLLLSRFIGRDKIFPLHNTHVHDEEKQRTQNQHKTSSNRFFGQTNTRREKSAIEITGT